MILRVELAITFGKVDHLNGDAFHAKNASCFQRQNLCNPAPRHEIAKPGKLRIHIRATDIVSAVIQAKNISMTSASGKQGCKPSDELMLAVQ